MLKHRIIPILLIDGNQQVVKPISFQRPYRKLGPLEQYVRVMERRNVDELILIDIEATAEGRKPRAEVIRKLTSSLFCPITYGGGISSLDDIKNCLASGADKVAIKSETWIIPRAVDKFGAQAIVGVIDCPTGSEIAAQAVGELFEEEGVGEILLTDIEKDGTLTGPNLDLIRTVDNSVGIPIVYCGGIRGGADCLEAIKAGASAVAIGSTFLYTETTPKDIAEYLHEHNVPIRL